MVEISVIVTAYNRKEFLNEALSSLEKQTIDKNNFEVILLTNFKYDVSDFTTINIRHFILDGTVGEYMYKAIRESNGEIVCFLDDDDIYSEEKLLTLSKNFTDDTVYYKHAVHPFRRKEEITGNIAKSSGKIKQIERADLMHPDIYAYNRTSIALRREFIFNDAEALSKLDVSEDWFFFLAFISSKGKGIYDENKLSYYRKHQSVSSKAITQSDENYNSYINYLNRLINSFNYMKTIFVDKFAQKILGFQLSVFRTRLSLLKGENDTSPSKEDIRNLFQASISNYNEFWIIKFLFLRGFIRCYLPKLSIKTEYIYAMASKKINSFGRS
jgi:glycosyltransferase involved in cell wall biosynthesis